MDKHKELNDMVFGFNEKIDTYNSKLDLRGFQIMACFTYVTAGYYACIKFGDEILWDSENEEREWIEEENRYEDLQGYVETKFNDYIDILKTLRFDKPVNKSKHINGAYDAIDEIIEDMMAREGFMKEWTSTDERIKDEIYDKWVGVILKHN